MHYFIRDKMAVYDKNFFLVSSGLLKKTPNLEEQFDLLDNLTWYTNNKCGLAHGLLGMQNIFNVFLIKLYNNSYKSR